MSSPCCNLIPCCRPTAVVTRQECAELAHLPTRRNSISARNQLSPSRRIECDGAPDATRPMWDPATDWRGGQMDAARITASDGTPLPPSSATLAGALPMLPNPEWIVSVAKFAINFSPTCPANPSGPAARPRGERELHPGPTGDAADHWRDVIKHVYGQFGVPSQPPQLQCILFRKQRCGEHADDSTRRDATYE